jgi:hypothetical protein
MEVPSNYFFTQATYNEAFNCIWLVEPRLNRNETLAQSVTPVTHRANHYKYLSQTNTKYLDFL